MSSSITDASTCSCGRRLNSVISKSSGECSVCRTEKLKAKGRAQAKKAIFGLLERDDILILDTETTGMGKRSEVIELSVINTKGETLLDTLIEPIAKKMNPYAQRVHNISPTMLRGAPKWPDVLPQLSEIADKRTILAWNASFDAKMLEISSELWDLPHPKWLFVCAMKLYAKGRGIKNRGLQKCVVDENLEHMKKEHSSHRALGDAYFTLGVLRASVKERRKKEEEKFESISFEDL